MPKENINLQLIIDGCRQNDRNCQRILFEQYMGYAMKICMRYASSREEAEEILNNSFLKIFTHIGTYKKEFPFRNWMSRVITNTAIDYLRANQKKLRFLELDFATNVEAESYLDIEPGDEMLLILQKLPPTYRLVFNLAIMEGYRHEEIGAILGISAATSRSNLCRAKDRLRKLMLENRKMSL